MVIEYKKALVLVICIIAVFAWAGCRSKKQEADLRSPYQTVQQRDRELFNTKTNVELSTVELDAQAGAASKKKVDDAQDKGEGQVKLNF